MSHRHFIIPWMLLAVLAGCSKEKPGPMAARCEAAYARATQGTRLSPAMRQAMFRGETDLNSPAAHARFLRGCQTFPAEVIDCIGVDPLADGARCAQVFRSLDPEASARDTLGPWRRELGRWSYSGADASLRAASGGRVYSPAPLKDFVFSARVPVRPGAGATFCFRVQRPTVAKLKDGTCFWILDKGEWVLDRNTVADGGKAIVAAGETPIPPGVHLLRAELTGTRGTLSLDGNRLVSFEESTPAGHVTLGVTESRGDQDLSSPWVVSEIRLEPR
jgi:hypothetical protein